MSYLATQRFHFTGSFQAAPSTVNNTITNYDPANFGPGTEPAWNPEGNHAFTLVSPGKVTFAQMADGTKVAAGDSIWALQVRPGSGPPAKIVDLDPQQQLVSTIFGLTLSLRQGGVALLKGKMAAAPFTEIWLRGTTGRGDERAAATYQSVLEELEWGDLSASPFLQELKARAVDGLLSLKFNLDGYSMDSSQAQKFTRGRLVGTIGVAKKSEPRHFVRGRQLNGLVNTNPAGLFVVPRDGINYCVANVDIAARKVLVDLGNALPTAPSGGATQDVGELALVCEAGAQSFALGSIDYLAPTWYEDTAGIVQLPVGRPLTDAELATLAEHPLALTRKQGAATVTAVREAAGGAHVRADLFVSRLNPGEEAEVQFYASRFGTPLPGAKVELQHRVFDADPPMAVPQSALVFPATVECDQEGAANVRLRASDPGNPRRYIDGQVYYVDYGLQGVGTLNPSDYLSVLVWDAYVAEDPPTWHGSMQRIFAQYANLYPRMNAIVNMASYDDLAASSDAMLEVIRLSESDAHYMPVTRDLSAAKRQAMVAWFSNPGADGKPLLGVPVPATVAVAAAAPARAFRAVDNDAGTKAQAAAEVGKLRKR